MDEVRLRGPERAAVIIATAALIVAVASVVVAHSGFAAAAPGKTVVRKVVVVRKGVVHKGQLAPGAVTAKSIARGAVTAEKIRKGAVVGAKLAQAAVGPEAIATGAVTPRSVAPGAVTAPAIAGDAVTAGAIAPGSVYGGALGSETVVTKPIADLDAVPSNIEWTASNTEAALCNPGERLLGGGFAFTNPGNREAAWLQALPVLSGETNGYVGRITTNSGGTAAAEVAAICLK
jgi:hypothetical protein